MLARRLFDVAPTAIHGPSQDVIRPGIVDLAIPIALAPIVFVLVELASADVRITPLIEVLATPLQVLVRPFTPVLVRRIADIVKV